MKTNTLPDPRRVRKARRQPTRASQTGRPPIENRMRGLQAPARCERCDARYENRTWRIPEVRTRLRDGATVTWTLCPACRQIEAQEYFGRVRVMGALPPAQELEVRRRIWNVERRARHTQPERRMVRLERKRGGLEAFTTSQKLAHRIAHELAKAFGGKSRYEWSERGGVLEATWDPGPARKAEPTRPRHPRK